MGAAEIAAAIRTQEITPLQAVNTHIERTMQVNPRINAVVTPMFKQARKEAQAATDYIAQNGTDGLPPLFGVPVTIKDSFAVEGERFTVGSWYLRDNIADSNATAVQKLLDAGAIIIGKTNLPDMTWLGETVNPIFGRTNNPHNLNHSAGGSSGGEGAIIAAGGSPLGLGSDLAGSIRHPSASNGIVGLKPTAGRISTQGHLPVLSEELADWNTAGPMARRVDDLALALNILSETPTRNYRDIKLAGRRCTVYLHNGLAPVHKSVVEAVMMASGTLKTAGLEVVRDDKLPMRSTLFTYTALFDKYNRQPMRDALGNGEAFSYLAELRANWRGESHISTPVLVYARTAEIFGKLLGLLGYGSLQRLERIREKFLQAMQPGGVLLMPIYMTPPPKHGWNYSAFFKPPYTPMFNALGFPAVVVPIHHTDKNLPLTVQIIAHPNEDEVALAVAAELERVYGGWQMAKI